MEKILDVNYNYVSLTSFERFVKEDLSKVQEEFTRDELLVGKSAITRLPKIRNLLKFSMALGMITKPNGGYRKSPQQEWREYFNRIQEDTDTHKPSRKILLPLIHSSEQFKEIISFLKSENVSRKEFIGFLMSKDENEFKESHYKLTAMALSNMLFEVGLIGRIRTKGGRVKRNRDTKLLAEIDLNLKETEKAEEQQTFFTNHGLKEILLKIGITKDEIVDMVWVLPDDKRKKLIKEII
ncbi:hypothetical protein HYW21_02350 [Candidatus Woesearchaeota archaeon]|nr:hypothetical protein [Candidatus Woesearchaeota archaeon]